MPNIIHDLVVELARVRALLPKLDEDGQKQGLALIRFGSEYMALNDYGAMREALDDLRAFGVKKKPEPQP